LFSARRPDSIYHLFLFANALLVEYRAILAEEANVRPGCIMWHIQAGSTTLAVCADTLLTSYTNLTSIPHIFIKCELVDLDQKSSPAKAKQVKAY